MVALAQEAIQSNYDNQRSPERKVGPTSSVYCIFEFVLYRLCWLPREQGFDHLSGFAKSTHFCDDYGGFGGGDSSL